MRMWLGVQPKELCDRHLVAEHGEIHKMAGHLAAGRSPEHWTSNGWIVLSQMQTRHDLLAAEMVHRGFNHDGTKLLKTHTYTGPNGCNDPDRDRKELAERPYKCKGRIKSLCLQV